MVIDTLKKYDEIVAIYGDTLNKLANASDYECEEAFAKLPLPEAWQKILTPFENMEIPFYFGLMPSEFWFALIKVRPDLREAARCFESGKIALVCAGEEIETVFDILTKDNPNTGFYWCDILATRPVFVKIADEKGAWEIIKNTAFCVEYLMREKPQFSRKFQFENIIEAISDEDKRLYFNSNPDLVEACKNNFPEQWNKFEKEFLK